MPVIELPLSKYHFYWSLYKRAEGQLQGESVSILVFSLEPVNFASGVTGEFVRLDVTEFGSSDIIIGVIPFVELVKLDYHYTEKMSHDVNWFFC